MKRFVILFVFIGLVLNGDLIFAGTNSNYADVLINPPLLISPSNGAQNLPIVVPLTWTQVDSASSYTINIAFDSLFTRMAYEENSVKSTSRDVAGLSWGTKYYWRVAANVNGAPGPWSAVRSFAIIVRTPLLLSPINFAINVPTKVKLNWEIIHNADYYVLEVSSSQGFSNYVFYGNVYDTVKVLDSLAPNTTYYWKLRAKNSNGFSEYTDIFNFTTVKPLPSPLTLVSPANGVQFQPVNLTLLWNSVPGAQSYRIQVSEDSTFAAVFFDNQTIKGTSVQIYGLNYGTKYYWRGNAATASGTTAFSQVFNFATILQAPELLSGIALAPGKIKLTWFDRSDNESGFIIERKLSSELTYNVIDTVKANFTSYTDANLTPGNTYKYRVKAFNKAALSNYSNEITIAAVTGVSKLESVPKDYYLFQNYPNPFNPSTKIQYALPSPSTVKLSVYNAIGQLVKEYTNIFESAGYHELNFEASDLPSGIYLYSLTAYNSEGAREFTSVRKMTLLR